MTTQKPTIEELLTIRDQADRELAEASRVLSEASSRAARARKARHEAVERLVEAREAEWARRAQT